MDWKRLLAYISGAIDDELMLRNEYLVTENQILRNQVKGRLQLTDGERKSLAEIGKKLGKKALEERASSSRKPSWPGIGGWSRRSLTARRAARIQVVPGSTRKWKNSLYALRTRIDPGDMIESSAHWRTSVTR